MYFYKENIISLYTMIYREFNRILRIWPQTILPSIVTTFLYFIIFGNLIGKRIGLMSGYNYIQYIVPGLIMMSLITTSYSNVVSSFFGSKFQKNIEELLISPTYNTIIIFGFISGGIIRGIIVSLLVIIVSNYFCDYYFYNIFIFLFVIFCSSILFSLFGLLNGILANKFDDINIIPTFILTPLIYLGGIFYSVELLPGFWNKLVYLNPIFYIINIFRYGILGITEVDIVTSLLFMLFFILFLYIFFFYLFNIGYNMKK